MSLLDRARRYLATRRDAYKTTFRGPLSEIVLKDLARFCFANNTTFVAENATMQNIAEGRRQVWLRIANHLHMSPDELWKLYDGREDDPAN